MAPNETNKCPNCGSDDIDVDGAVVACVTCGTQLEYSNIVAEVGFTEDARGRASAIGQRVSEFGYARRIGPIGALSTESIQNTMKNASQMIQGLATSLKIPRNFAQNATRLYRLALERNFTKGRRFVNVCSVCLYVVCRREKTSHMLIDFAEHLNLNVYFLGNMFLKMLIQLDLTTTVPLVDPSLYIHRFAANLEFGEKTENVARTALRLLSRMRRHWISHGRRPAGLCAATLIIAARCHNFHRTQVEVAKVVRMGCQVLNTRMKEFGNTPCSNLTLKKIETGGGEDGKDNSNLLFVENPPTDPPAFQFALMRKEREEKERNASEINNQTEERLEDDVEKALASSELKNLEVEIRELEEQATQIAIAAEDAGSVRRNNADDEDQNMIAVVEELSELGDDEVLNYINTQEEYERKKIIWTEQNKDYIEHQEKMKRLELENPEEFRRLYKRRKRTKKNENAGGLLTDPPNSVEGSGIGSAPAPKSSSKIDYSALDMLDDQE